MTRPSSLRRLSGSVLFLTVLAAACGEAGPTEPVGPLDVLDFPQDQPLATTMPSLASEAGTEGTDRYVATLERVLRHAVGVIHAKIGAEAATRVMAEVQRLQGEVLAAKESGDMAAAKEAATRMELFAAHVGLRVFGPPLAQHVAQAAGQHLQNLTAHLKAAHEAGHDVSGIVPAVQMVQKNLEVARKAWENDQPEVGLVHAARALDLVAKIGAVLGSS